MTLYKTNEGGGWMPSLTHVCIWDNGVHRWKRITASEAASIFPYTVEAKSGIFMCELCHQYVYLTRPGKNRRYFGHTPEEDKSCPERTFGVISPLDCDNTKHDLPIRIKLQSSDFELEIGLLGIPQSSVDELRNQMIRIHPAQLAYRLKERLRADAITYVSIGQIPFPEYQIELDCRNIYSFSHWPERIRGIDPAGTIFDADSRKKLPYDADVQVRKVYYLLKAGHIGSVCTSISLERTLMKPISGRYWYLYKVQAITFDEKAAKFFLKFHCRLTDQPISIQPIWPVYTKSPYVIHHNSKQMVFHVRGDVTTKCFPTTNQQSELLGGMGTLEFVQCSDRQQLISAGHTYLLGVNHIWRRLKYTYLRKEPLNRTTEQPTVSVTDIMGQAVPSGQANQLPYKNILRISAPYDGLVIVRRKGRVIEKRRLKADTISEFDAVQFGCKLEVFQGLDRTWSIYYQKVETAPEQDEGPLLRRLKKARGPLVLVPHSWGAVAGRLDAYPQIKGWLYQKIREGCMPVSAQCEFRQFIENLARK